MSHQNIKNNNVRSIYCRMLNDKYYDFMLYKGEVYSPFEPSECLAADFSDFDIDELGRLFSTVTWKDAVNNGVELDDIGFTGTDNGLITFRKDRISNQQFLDLLTGSTYSIDSSDTRFFFTPVSGNTQSFDYPMSVEETEDEKYLSLKGGFYQGFFKLYGFDYQTLPTTIGDGLTLEFMIRPRSDYEVGPDTINTYHPENKGIFWYVGTRAENKFWSLYGVDSAVTENLKTPNAVSDGYFSCSGDEYNILYNPVVYSDYLHENANEPSTTPEPYFSDDYTISAATKDCPCISEPQEWCDYFSENNDYFGDEGYLMPASRYAKNYGVVSNYTGHCDCSRNGACSFPDGEFLTIYDLYSYKYESDSHCGCGPGSKSCGGRGCKKCDTCDTFFQDDYYDEQCGDQNPIDSEYFGQDAVIDENNIYDSFGHALVKKGYYQIESDNKFLMFDRTKEGFTVHDWVEGTKVLLTGRQDNQGANYFLLMNRTCTGYTVNTIEQYNDAHSAEYNIYRDIRDNAFALKVNDDGSIGYRYGSLDCESDEQGYKLIEEKSKPGIVKTDEWNQVVVKFVPLAREQKGKCGSAKSGPMKIMIYVNCNLVLISRELRGLRLRELNDQYEKQEAVPYSMSLGGGSLGLLESILPDYYNSPNYTLPIERDFCGSFVGDIKLFKIYDCFLDYSTIKTYLCRNKISK